MRMRGYIRTSSFRRLFSFRRRTLDDGLAPEKLCNEPRRPSWRCFSYDELFIATHGFSPGNLVGRGGCAEVYRGVLGDGQTIAVKRIAKGANEKDFLTEIGTLGHVSHPNIMALLGCCVDNGLYLVFNFSPVGSVASLLHDDALGPIDWKTRYKIAVGTARGLHYLHNVCPRRIIHRDVKSSNILLAEDFEPQISDFGLAKWLPSQWTHHSIAPIEGTFGHIAPEYLRQGFVDEKTDVYAFGVFLLELISGKEPVDSCHQSLHGWARPILKRGDVKQVVDPRLGPHYNVAQLTKLAFAASLCIRPSPVCRPAISKVLEIIEMEEGIVMDAQRWKSQVEGEEEEEEEEEEEDAWVWGLELGDEDDDWDTCSTISRGSN